MNNVENEENDFYVRYDAHGRVDKNVYTYDSSREPGKVPAHYFVLKKVNSSDPAIPYTSISAEQVDEWNKTDKLNSRFVNLSLYHNRQLMEKAEALGDTPLKALDGTYYFFQFDRKRFENDLEAYRESESQRLRSFMDDALGSLGVRGKSWANVAYDRAYERGHSEGFDLVYEELETLVAFAEKVEKQTNVDFYKKKTNEGYVLIKDVLETLPSGERGSLNWLNPDTQINMKQFEDQVGRVLHPENYQTPKVEAEIPKKKTVNTRTKLGR